MNSVKTSLPSTLVIAIALMAMVLAYADAQSSVTEPAPVVDDHEAPLSRTPRASRAEAEITRTNLGGRMEAVLGDTFGGVWFEPETAQMHVGVTSSSSRRLAETVAARAGLSELVTEVPVASTWAQLDAAQARWDRRLYDLLSGGEAVTALLPDRNAVSIELGSSVPDSRRATLERAAEHDNVEILIGVAPRSNLGSIPTAQCKAFKKEQAFCDDTIVGGVTIKGPEVKYAKPSLEEEEAEEEDDLEFPEGELEIIEEEEGGGKKIRSTCTAGPAVRPTDHKDKDEATGTYILTAGHCLDGNRNGGGVNASWAAWDKAGTEREIGKATAYITKKTDIGLIKVNANYWAKPNNYIPLVPTIAPWSGAEVASFPVVDQREPMLKAKTCMSGQTSGIKCNGEVITTDLTGSIRGVVIENLVEVKGILPQGGDSGGPVFAQAEYEQTPKKGYVEGVIVGFNKKSNNLVFHSMKVALEKLKDHGHSHELLTTSNRIRHEKVKAGAYPATLDGTAFLEEFTTEAGAIQCTGSTYHAILAEASSTLSVSPHYTNCTGPFGINVTIHVEGCSYVFHVAETVSTDNYLGNVDVSCPAGKSIKVTVATCQFEVKSQSELKTVDLVNDTGAEPAKDVTVRPTVEGIAYIVTVDGFLCPFKGVGEKIDGKHTSTGNTTITGQNPSEPAEEIDIEIAE
jgi:Trypsin